MSIEQIISRYAIQYDGQDSIAVNASVTEEDIAFIRSQKPQILSYLKRQRLAEQDRVAREHEVINNIPGVALLRKAQQDSGMHFSPNDLHSPFSALVAEYPDIDFDIASGVLEIESARFSVSQDLAQCAQLHYSNIASGREPKNEVFLFQADRDKLYARILWD